MIKVPRFIHWAIAFSGCSLLAAACGSADAPNSAGGGGAAGGLGGLGGTAGDASAGTSAGAAAGTSAGGNLPAGGSGGQDGGSAGIVDAEAGAAGASASCTTRVSYGDAWIHTNHPALFDDVNGPVTWDGKCTNQGSNSVAKLSNGWAPVFTGHDACLIALDSTCADAGTCRTRVTYAAAWQPPAAHPATFDDLAGRVFWDGSCVDAASTSSATLSNGSKQTFTGSAACGMSFAYEQCGGLYQNPVIPSSCPDPGVLRDGSNYILSCTSGGAANAFPIRTSTDLVHWQQVGSIFPSASKPKWAIKDFWAPEIHHVGSHYVAYFTARHSDGQLSIGAATATSPTGPFQDIGQPLVHDATIGLIDATEFADANGKPYLVWKVDGNAVKQHTPIYGQALSADGTTLTGTRQTLITNDLAWEGGVVEGPWVVLHGGQYFLFYSGNSYANATYAVGVARADNPLGPYTKLGNPILKSNADWIGPGHCSVIDTPEGDSYMVYHAWHPDKVGGRPTLVDAVQWGAWPSVREAPSLAARPMP